MKPLVPGNYGAGVGAVLRAQVAPEAPGPDEAPAPFPNAGAKGISRVEIQVDDAPWQAAELREPLSELTWVIWRYDWPFTEGTHWLAVRAYDGQGRLQVTEETKSHMGTAVTGLYKEYRTIEPLQP
jgi:hypothetical protein